MRNARRLDCINKVFCLKGLVANALKTNELRLKVRRPEVSGALGIWNIGGGLQSGLAASADRGRMVATLADPKRKPDICGSPIHPQDFRTREWRLPPDE